MPKAPDIATFEIIDVHTHKKCGKTFTSPWKPGYTRYDGTEKKAPYNVCKLKTGRGMKGCAILWLQYYGSQSEKDFPRPQFVSDYLELHGEPDIASLSCSSNDDNGIENDDNIPAKTHLDMTLCGLCDWNAACDDNCLEILDDDSDEEFEDCLAIINSIQVLLIVVHTRSGKLNRGVLYCIHY